MTAPVPEMRRVMADASATWSGQPAGAVRVPVDVDTLAAVLDAFEALIAAAASHAEHAGWRSGPITDALARARELTGDD